MAIRKKKSKPKEKGQLHPRNKHQGRYDLEQLVITCPDLAPFVIANIHSAQTIDFANPDAVKMLNRALLMQHYGIVYWDIPAGYLCPPIPGRADYIHHAADLLISTNGGQLPPGDKIRCLDIGVGANMVYPIIGNHTYGWSFVGTDIDPVALASAQKIVDENPGLTESVTLRLQKNPGHVFSGVLRSDERFDLVVCNPPFHASQEAAEAGTLRKLSNLNEKKVTTVARNFGGQNGELWCEGGEAAFLEKMANESAQFPNLCLWYSALVSKQSNLRRVEAALEKAGAKSVRVVPMGQGNKTSRMVAWTFFTNKKQQEWKQQHWDAPALVTNPDLAV